MKKIKKITKIFYWVIFILILAIAALAWASVYEGPGKFKVYIVQSGSMEPTIKTGSLVLDSASGNYKEGDVITFKDSKLTVTHRIFKIELIAGKKVFTTKGDANNTEDYNRITEDQITGKVVLSIPYLGYVASFAKTQIGIIVLVVIPATIIIYSELVTIKNESIKLLAERKKRKLTLAEKIEVEMGVEEVKTEKSYKKLWKKIIRPKKE